MKLECDSFPGTDGIGEIFVFKPLTKSSGDGEFYLPVMIGGSKVWLSRASALDMGELLIRYAAGDLLK